jgi:hypothetical protein
MLPDQDRLLTILTAEHCRKIHKRSEESKRFWIYNVVQRDWVETDERGMGRAVYNNEPVRRAKHKPTGHPELLKETGGAA